MLSDAEFEIWCNRAELSPQQKEFVNRIRTSPPARRVRGSSRNVHGPYASKKMGRTIQFESHTVELPAIVQFYENDDSVLEYWDQPIKFTIHFFTPRETSHHNCSGTLIFSRSPKKSCGFEEWKTEKKLERLGVEQPERYQNLDGKWIDVIVQEYIENLGYYYNLRSDREIDWVKYRFAEVFTTLQARIFRTKIYP